MKKLFIYVLSLLTVSILYQGPLFFLIPLSAILIPIGLIVTYHKYLFRNNYVGKLLTVVVTLGSILVGVLAHHVGWVYSVGNWNYFLYPDPESAVFLKGFSVINLGGALIVGIIFCIMQGTERVFQFKRRDKIENKLD